MYVRSESVSGDETCRLLTASSRRFLAISAAGFAGETAFLLIFAKGTMFSEIIGIGTIGGTIVIGTFT